MKSRIFKTSILLIGLFLSLPLSACNRPDQVLTDETPYYQMGEMEEPQGLIVSQEEFTKSLSEIPSGSRVIVEDEYRDLLPAGLQLLDFYRFYEAYRYPDTRVDPFTADYLLGHESLYFRAILAPPILWKRVSTTNMPDQRVVSLIKRTADLDESLLSAATPAGLEKMVQVRVRPAWYKSAWTFSIQQYEVSHYQYAAFLNEAQIPLEKVDIYYSIKDPASKIVYYQGRYRVLRGYSTIPVFNVSWIGAKAYCQHYKLDLPDQGLWLLAAGEKDGRSYPWGNETDFEIRGNFTDTKDGFDLWAPVDAFPKGRSRHGLYNMGGNLYEWTESTILMGGCLEFEPETARLDRFEINEKMARNIHDGFRCVSK